MLARGPVEPEVDSGVQILCSLVGHVKEGELDAEGNKKASESWT